MIIFRFIGASMGRRQKPQDEMKYLWKYFEFHANQRITLFKYYIIFISAYFYGTGYLVINFPNNSDIHEMALMAMSLFFMFITCFFKRLDYRNRQLIRYAEKGIKKNEEKLGNKKYLKIFTKEHEEAKEVDKKLEKRYGCKKWREFHLHRHTAIFSSLSTTAYIIAVLCILLSIGSMLS